VELFSTYKIFDLFLLQRAYTSAMRVTK